MRYFTLREDFAAIAQVVFRDERVLTLKKIETGWTNIVLEVKTDKENYILRFPRDDFWARAIEKDVEVAQFVHGKTDTVTVSPELYYDGERPFTVHRRLEGIPLVEVFQDLGLSEIKMVAQEIATFLFQLHQIKFERSEVFRTTNFGQEIAQFLDELLTVHVAPEAMEFWGEATLENGGGCLVHGDFNTSNILVGSDRHVAAILDFGFGGIGNKYWDLGRALSRDYPEGFSEELIKAYGELEGELPERDLIEEKAELWRKIDQAYVQYMREAGFYHQK